MGIFDINTGIDSVANLINNIITRVVKDPQQQADIALKVQELQQNGELAKMTNDTELFKAEVDDRKSARLIHTTFTDFLAVCLISICCFILYYILTEGISAQISDMTAGMIIGAFVTVITQVVGYYFGSSSSSNKKTEALANALGNKVKQDG